MNQFVLYRKNYLGYYGILWSVCTFLLIALLHWHAGFTWRVALADAMVSTILLFALSLAVWYVVRFSRDGKGFGAVVNAMAAGAVLLTFSLYLSLFILRKLFSAQPEYLLFLQHTLLIRLILGVLTAMMINLFIFSIHLIAEARNAYEREHKLTKLVQHTELQALKNQLNPHFIYNSLNAISSLTTLSPEKAREMIIKLSEFLRYALKQDALQLTTLSLELEAIEMYLQIEKVRFGDRLSYKFEVDEKHREALMPSMILQPLFENAIKHGVQKSGLPGQVLLATEILNNDLILKVSNPYDRQSARFRSEGVGLENTRNRLRVIYGNGQLLQVEATESVFTATLTLPFNTQ